MQTNLDTLIKQTSSPSEYADFLGEEYSSNISKEHKKKLGQFFTPIQIAKYMGSLASEPITDSITILDPGCGTGTLACSLIEVLSKFKVRQINLYIYEIDSNLLPYTEKALKYLKSWLLDLDIKFKFKLINIDFIVDVASKNNSTEEKRFDYIISNPPYFKLPKTDKRVALLKDLVKGQPNIYSFFMAAATKLLKDSGEMIFITPRSFASGQYFNTFRSYFFKQITLERVHLFKSRNKTFNRDKVLQETLIIKATKSNKTQEVIVSTSEGAKDIQHSFQKKYPINDLIDLQSKAKILYLPTTELEEKIIRLFKTWENNLIDFGIQVSTGPVVSFRAKPYLFEQYQNSTIFLTPLYWLNNITKMSIDWPLKLKSKSQYIVINEESKKILLPNKNYVFLRRFSSKDDKSRLIAAPYLSSTNKASFIGVENKLNYIYKLKGNLVENQIIGISAILNSTIFDTYFRTFNGNVNVSATEIRLMPFPNMEVIQNIGDTLIKEKDYSEDRINSLTNLWLSECKIETPHD